MQAKPPRADAAAVSSAIRAALARLLWLALSMPDYIDGMVNDCLARPLPGWPGRLVLRKTLIGIVHFDLVRQRWSPTPQHEIEHVRASARRKGGAKDSGCSFRDQQPGKIP